MKALERASWVAGIVGTIFAITWGVWTYLRAPESSLRAHTNSLTVNGNQSVLIQGNNNVIGAAPAPSAQQGQFNPEAFLETLTTGISRASLESQLGPAKFDDKDRGLGVNNLIFVFPRFFLQAVISREGRMIFYSVTMRSPQFRPTIPKLGGKLLESRFATFGQAELVYSDMTSKYYEYAEKIYLGNPGNYSNVYIGFCPAGVLPVWGKFVPVILERDGAETLKRFRANNVPNCFGVGDILGDEEKILLNLRMGIDYYVARDIP